MALGNTLSDYEIIAPLGRGAHSIVYHVTYRDTGEEYALKIMEKRKLEQNKLMKRLENEVEIQSSFCNQNLLKLYHSFEDRNSVYLVLEL
jgi:3-phosphoinositide dependent protein kinase-1